MWLGGLWKKMFVHKIPAANMNGSGDGAARPLAQQAAVVGRARQMRMNQVNIFLLNHTGQFQRGRPAFQPVQRHFQHVQVGGPHLLRQPASGRTKRRDRVTALPANVPTAPRRAFPPRKSANWKLFVRYSFPPRNAPRFAVLRCASTMIAFLHGFLQAYFSFGQHKALIIRSSRCQPVNRLFFGLSRSENGCCGLILKCLINSRFTENYRGPASALRPERGSRPVNAGFILLISRRKIRNTSGTRGIQNIQWQAAGQPFHFDCGPMGVKSSAYKMPVLFAPRQTICPPLLILYASRSVHPSDWGI